MQKKNNCGDWKPVYWNVFAYWTFFTCVLKSTQLFTSTRRCENQKGCGWRLPYADVNNNAEQKA